MLLVALVSVAPDALHSASSALQEGTGGAPHPDINARHCQSMDFGVIRPYRRRSLVIGSCFIACLMWVLPLPPGYGEHVLRMGMGAPANLSTTGGNLETHFPVALAAYSLSRSPGVTLNTCVVICARLHGWATPCWIHPVGNANR